MGRLRCIGGSNLYLQKVLEFSIIIHKFHLITQLAKFSYTTTFIDNIIYEISCQMSSKINKNTNKLKKKLKYYVKINKIKS